MAKKQVQHTQRDVPAVGRDMMLHLRQQMDETLDQMTEFEKELLQTPLVRGFSIWPHGDRLQLRPFGTLLDSKSLKDGWREPFVGWSFDQETNHLDVTAEMPGVRRDDIQLDVGPDHLRLEARGKHSNYRAFLEPGMSLDPDRVEATYEDGVLTIRTGVQRESAKRVRHIDVGAPA